MKFKSQIIGLSLLILGLALVNQAIRAESKKSNNNSGGRLSRVEFFETRGSSLAPLINPGETIRLVYGYYDYQPVEREDLVAYNYAGQAAPIIKIVKAIPGDEWRLEKNNRQNSYQIIVNGQPLKNSENEFYQISESNIQILKLYVRNYPTIPENTYLILGNQTTGTLDATRFGLISKRDIVGKAERRDKRR